MSGVLHEQLRHATAALHGQLDAHSVLSCLTAPELQPATYQAVMLQHWLAYRYWQRQLDAVFAALPLPTVWRIDLAVGLLMRDCPAHLRAAVEPLTPAPLCVDGLAQYLGCAYVFTGSRLGAHVLLKALHSRRTQLGIDRFHYYEAMARPIPAGWSGWMRQLEAYAVTHDLSFTEIADGACQCFAVITEWFGQPRGYQLAGKFDGDFELVVASSTLRP